MLSNQFEALKYTTCKSELYKRLLINEYHKSSVELNCDNLLSRTNLILLASYSGLNEVMECMKSIKFIK